MLGVALKNTILVVLIILIIHFLIKSFMLVPEKEAFSEPPTGTCAGKPMQELDEYFGCKPAPEYKCSKSDDDASKKDVPMFVKMETEETKCNPYEGQPIPGTTCDPQFTVNNDVTKPLKSDCVLDQPNPNAFLILNQYENENQMNNEEWLDNIGLYDDFSSSFGGYQCNAKFESI